MQTISIDYVLKWEIVFAPKYKFTVCKKLINVNTGKEKKKCYNNGSIGYWIGRKFYTLDKLRDKIRLIPFEKIEF